MSKDNVLWKLLARAFAFSATEQRLRAERTLIDEFNARLAGNDEFGTEALYENSFVLATCVEHGSVSLRACYGDAVVPIGRSCGMSQYRIVGEGLMMRYMIGDPLTVRSGIEESYRTAIRLLEGEFDTLIGKSVPYTATEDRELIDVANGVVEVRACDGSVTQPLCVDVPTIRLRDRGYCDLRMYRGLDDLAAGVFAVWDSLVSSRGKDRELFQRLTDPVFERMDLRIPF